MGSLLTAMRSPVPLLAAVYGFLAVADELIAWQAGATSKGVGAALLLAIVAEERGRRLDARAAGRIALPVLALALWSATSLLWTMDADATWARSRHLLFEALLIAGLCVVGDRRRLLSALAVGVGAGAVVLTVGFVAALGAPHGARLYAFGAHPNLQGRDIALGVLALAALSGLPRRGVIAAAAIGGVGLGLSFSAGAWLASVVAAAVLARERSHRAAVGALLLGLLVGAGALSVAGAESRLRSPATALRGDAVEEIGSGRLVLWAHAGRIWAAHRVLGVGAGAFPVALEEVRAAHQHAGGEHTKPGRRSHSVYLDLLAETGPLGLALFLLPLGLALRRGRLRGDAVAGALLVFVLASAATDSLLHQKSLWLALAIAALACRDDE